jgi:hypothetical protein
MYWRRPQPKTNVLVPQAQVQSQGGSPIFGGAAFGVGELRLDQPLVMLTQSMSPEK